jgi:hypothetical protein
MLLDKPILSAIFEVVVLVVVSGDKEEAGPGPGTVRRASQTLTWPLCDNTHNVDTNTATSIVL